MNMSFLLWIASVFFQPGYKENKISISSKIALKARKNDHYKTQKLNDLVMEHAVKLNTNIPI